MDDFLETFVGPVLVNVIRTVLGYVQEEVQGTDKGNVRTQEPRSLRSTQIDNVALLQRSRRQIPFDTSRRYSNQENMLQTPALRRDLTEPFVWDDKLEKSLITEIKRLHSYSLQNVLIVGPIGASKSSFINSAISIFQRFKYSFSKDAAYKLPIFPRFRSAEYLHGNTVFCLPDETYIGEGINIVDSKLFVKSSIKERYLFSPTGTVPIYSDRYRHRFKTGCQIHCVIFIISAKNVISDVPENIQIKRLRQKLRRTHIPVVFVLTMVDMICDEIEKDITKMYRSKKVLEVIETASEMFEIGKDSIHPVVNYVNESEMRTEKNIPILLALRHSLYLASEYLQSITEYLQMESDDDDDKDLLPFKGRRYLPEQIPMGKKLTFESRLPDFSTSIDRVEKLLDENMLPIYDDIHTIKQFCGRQSEQMKKLCGNICKVVNRKVYNDTATDIWTAWDPKSDQIVFVVELAKQTRRRESHTLPYLELIEYKSNDSTIKKESHMVMAKEKELLKNHTYDTSDLLQKLRTKVSTYSDELMDKHKNITAIFPSIVKSVGYMKSHRLIERLCISIRVEKKVSGLIPLEEEPIKKYVGRFPTDVIQGDFRFLCGGPNDFHENIKIGSAIHAGLVTDKGELLGGTMGCFVKHKNFGLCCLTSAHVILSQAEIHEVLQDGYREYDEKNLKPVYQPISNTLSQFGKVVAAACNEGQTDTPGVEVALIKILCRKPICGSFPLTDSKKSYTFTFNSGNVADAKLVKPLTEVFKFGIQTGSTFGLLGIPGVSVCFRGGPRLKNQLVIMPKKDTPFAEKGDSGSSAFIGMSCPGTESAIGLVSGGFDSGQVLVTPIHAALKAVQCPPYLHRFEDADSGFNDDFSRGCENMDCS